MPRNNRCRPSKKARAILRENGGVKAIYQEMKIRQKNTSLYDNNSPGEHQKSNNIIEGHDWKI